MENDENSKHSKSNLIHECKQLLSRNCSVSLKHIYREGNQVVDFLANFSLDLNTRDVMTWSTPPRGMRELLE